MPRKRPPPDRRAEPAVPSTLRRSPAKARRTFAKTLESAERTYGPGERAARTAWAAVKHGFDKQGDHWVAHDAARTGSPADESVPAQPPTRRALYEQARQLGIAGRSRMTRDELAEAVRRGRH